MEEKNQKITPKDLGELNQKEIDLIYWIRTRFRFGELIILVRDGLPYRITKAFESKDL